MSKLRDLARRASAGSSRDEISASKAWHLPQDSSEEEEEAVGETGGGNLGRRVHSEDMDSEERERLAAKVSKG